MSGESIETCFKQKHFQNNKALAFRNCKQAGKVNRSQTKPRMNQKKDSTLTDSMVIDFFHEFLIETQNYARFLRGGSTVL